MNNNEIFKEKFNELDKLCRELYPESKWDKDGFRALRLFSKTLSVSDSKTLNNIINSRNIYTHDRPIINFSQDAISFIQGLIDGVKRKLYNKSNIAIDSNIENLRTKNLRQMSEKINEIAQKFCILSRNEINNIKNEMMQYIDMEKKLMV